MILENELRQFGMDECYLKAFMDVFPDGMDVLSGDLRKFSEEVCDINILAEVFLPSYSLDRYNDIVLSANDLYSMESSKFNSNLNLLLKPIRQHYEEKIVPANDRCDEFINRAETCRDKLLEVVKNTTFSRKKEAYKAREMISSSYDKAIEFIEAEFDAAVDAIDDELALCSEPIENVRDIARGEIEDRLVCSKVDAFIRVY